MATKKGLNRGWSSRRFGADRRIGRIQRQIRRAFIVSFAGTLTTRELVQFAYPGGARVPDKMWRNVRRAAERWAMRDGKRRRPLRWRAKPNLLFPLSWPKTMKPHEMAKFGPEEK